MSLLAYQLNNKNIQKVLTLNYKQLYKKATDAKVPFNEYYEWLKKQVFQMKFEHMYKKKLEFEFAKFLIDKYEVKQNHF